VKAAGHKVLYMPEAMKQRHVSITDERLSEIDGYFRKKYLGLYEVLATERFLPDCRTRADEFLKVHLDILDEIIEENTVSISSMYDHFFYLAAGLLAFEKEGAHFAFVGCGVPAGRVIALQTPHETWANLVSEVPQRVSLKEAVEELKQDSALRIPYMMKPQRNQEKSKSKRLKTAWRRKRYQKFDHDAGTYFPTPFKHWPIGHNKLYRKLGSFNGYTPSWDVCASNEIQNQGISHYAFLALHMEPEATILMYSEAYRDQIEICRQVAQVLPYGYKLLVKENPKMLKRRKKGFYDALMRIPNLVLVSTKVPSAELVKGAEAVVSIGGTVTIEAKLLGKRAYCLGKPPFYRFADATGCEVLSHLSRLSDPIYPNKSIDREWEHWMNSTFVARSGRCEFDSEAGWYVFDSSRINVTAYLSCIMENLKKC
jgi:hypothetical protein